MRKKQKQQLTIGIIIILAIIGIIYFSGNLLPFSTTVISISNIEIKDEGSRILVTAIPQGTDDFEIQLTPSKLNSFLESHGLKATKTSTLKMKYVESSKKFYFSTNEFDINTVKLASVVDTGNDLLMNCGINMCQERGGGKCDWMVFS